MIKNYTIWKHFINILIGIDQFFNAVIAGHPDETISSRAGKWVRDNSQVKGGVWYWLCRGLHLIDKNHCLDSIENDEGNKIYKIWK